MPLISFYHQGAEERVHEKLILSGRTYQLLRSFPYGFDLDIGYQQLMTALDLGYLT